MPLSRARERLLRRITTRRGREAEGVVLIEGPRAIRTAMELGAELVFALRDQGSAESPESRAVVAELTSRGVEMSDVESPSFRELADTDAPQGVLAVAREPRPVWPPPIEGPARPRRVLVLDRVQDPGNVGTLIRTAAALGVDGVIALPGTADPWGAKVVRASAGTVFGLPMHSVEWDELSRWLDGAGVPLLVADARGEDVRTRRPGASWALLLANEAGGPSDAALARADAVVSIPLERGVESLNVAAAGAILLWTLGPADPPPEPT